MPSRYRLRRIFGPPIRWAARGFIALGLSPNTISLLAFLIAVLAALTLIFFQCFLLYALFVFIAGFLDGVDGEVARRTNRASPVGGYLDSILDRLADTVILLPFLWIAPPLPYLGPAWIWVFTAIAGCILVSYTRSRAIAAGATDTDVGLAARSERLFLLVITSLLYILHPWSPYLGLILFSLICHLTVIYRTIYYHHQLKTRSPRKN
ncbi:MAG: CDP-alcohol phosphatidyltransferase family protein [Promethearchaeota archaeon]